MCFGQYLVHGLLVRSLCCKAGDAGFFFSSLRCFYPVDPVLSQVEIESKPLRMHQQLQNSEIGFGPKGLKFTVFC